MGARGPKPLPANVHILRGNPGHKSLADLVDTLQPEIEIPDCPKHLLPEARKEWRRIGPQLERYGLVSKIDRTALALYCQSYARWVWAEAQLQRNAKIADAKRVADEELGEEWNGGDGYSVPTPSGFMIQSVHLTIANKAMEQVNRFLSSFGMDPTSRGRVNPSAIRQRDLFDEAGSGFNDL